MLAPLVKKCRNAQKQQKFGPQKEKLDPPIFFVLFMAMVILSVSVERFSVSRMWDLKKKVANTPVINFWSSWEYFFNLDICALVRTGLSI